MSRRKRYCSSSAALASGSAKHAARRSWYSNDLWEALTKPRQAPSPKIKPQEMTFVLQNLATLVGNGVSLPRALGTLAKEDALSKHRDVLDTIRRKVEGGTPFSTALQAFPHICDGITLSQIRVGERSGTLVETLHHLSKHRDKSRELRRQIVNKLAYPALLCILGSGLITFLLLYVVPVFEKTYADAGVELPVITQGLMTVGGIARHYVVWFAGLMILGVVTVKQLRKSEVFAGQMDRRMLSLPVVGNLFRNMAVLQVMEVLNNLMTAGFTLADALKETADSVSNRAVKQGVRDLQRAVQRGERFSRELERHEELFPPMVNQLVIVGESTGQLNHSTMEICEHLRREIERKTTLMVGALEPVLTISLAAAIAMILLAIYLPMFDMVNTVS